MLRESLDVDVSAPPSPIKRIVDVPLLEDIPSIGISANSFSPGYFQRFFVVQKELGRGGQGVVLLVTHVLDNVDLGHYACKRIPVGNNHAWLANVLNEVRLLEPLSHQHLVHYKHVWLEDVQISTFGPSVPCAFILQQYCNAGDLYHYIVGPVLQDQGTERRLSFEQIYSFFRDITSGLHHLHSNGFVHRDLKPSNCLLHESGKGLRALVSDFGEVQVKNMARRSSGATGTVSFCAPEVLRLDASTGTFGNFTTKSDIFSLGMTLYFLCFARLPYRSADALHEENEDIDELKAEISAWDGLQEERDIRPDLPESLYISLRMLLAVDPAQRPSTEDILRELKISSSLSEPVYSPPPRLLIDRSSRRSYEWHKIAHAVLIGAKMAAMTLICSPRAIKLHFACIFLLLTLADLLLPLRFTLPTGVLFVAVLVAALSQGMCMMV